ncbi:MAG: ATP-binding protein [bacterium]|nr:ATP-binding protein [bacterium]
MPPDLETRVRALLLELRMRDAAEALSEMLPKAATKRVIVLEVMEAVLQHQSARAAERRIIRRIDGAKFPDMPTLETFDFDFQTGIDRGLVLDLATLAWMDRNEDLVLIGQSGTGKSHIAKSLCLIACKQQRRVLYTSCAAMLSDLFASMADNTLAMALKKYTSPSLLLIDDLGYDPIEQEHAREAQLLYKVLEARHEKCSTIITSNLSAESWADYLGNHYLTVALLDRLLYHGTVITIEGPSWRLAQHKKRQEEQARRRAEREESQAEV